MKFKLYFAVLYRWRTYSGVLLPSGNLLESV
nr:MAG TPA: hypothetical protein [Caudoviricetes sp.]